MPSNRTQFFIAGLLIFTGGIFSGAKIFEAGLDGAAATASSLKVEATDTASPAFVPTAWEDASSFDPSAPSVSAKLSLQMTGKVTVSSSPTYAAVAGNYAYTAHQTGKKFQILDISGANPTVLSTVSLQENPRVIAQSGNYVYIGYATDKVEVFNVIDPHHPVLVSVGGNQTTILAVNNPRDMVAVGNYLYTVGTAGNLEIFDMSVMSNARRVGSVNLGSTVNLTGLAVAGRYAFVTSELDDAVFVVDISNPAAPSVARNIGLGVGFRPKDIVAFGQYAYVASVLRSEIAVINITNPLAASVKKVFSTGTDSKPSMLAVANNYLYFAKDAAPGVTLVDISNPLMPSVAASFNNENHWVGSIVARGDKLYIGGRVITSPFTNFFRVVQVVKTETPSLQ